MIETKLPPVYRQPADADRTVLVSSRRGRDEASEFAKAAQAAKAAVEAGRFTVAEVETKPLKRNPAPPFTTSTLQQILPLLKQLDA